MNHERIVNGVKTRVLHNKDYVEVAERVRIVHELKKKVEMVESTPFQVLDRWIWRVVIRVDDCPYIGNAEVKLNAQKNTPDGTNPFECAETSALGRALAFAGLGTVESIASYDEIARSQPFTAVVEQPQRRVVDAPHAPAQLPRRASNAAPIEPVPLPLDKIPVASQLRKRCEELFGPDKWDEVQAKLFDGKCFSDEDMTPERCQRMHRSFEITTQRREASAKAS